MNIAHCYHHENKDELAMPVPENIHPKQTFSLHGMTLTVRSMMAFDVRMDRMRDALKLHQSCIDRAQVFSKIDWILSEAKSAKKNRDIGQEDMFG